ncbi:LOW QUALITY PROTEIN: high mobility group nucleosome-binding domain-containing protein 5, partial [Pangasianodon hypophthalmus]|uniref:LOW QUALITY PROTEIN: high mobility group nucleosome-binding domain-containing protein 5 n=1 Tax=Pangasianodon hypophthalmus TaxID=310915 RepID=UPI0023075D4E
NLLISIAVVEAVEVFAQPAMCYEQGWRAVKGVQTGAVVALLQYRLQELSERERRARNHNQKLLQDFQRAQNTLSDLVARTEAMNTIRMEYERYLEENYPKWQQKLQDKRLSEQRKMIERHLNACTPQTEEEGQRIDRGSKQYMQGNIQNSIHSSFPSMWLTQSQPAGIEPEHSNISKNTKNIQNVHQALNSSLLDPSLLSGDPLHSLYSIVPQNPPFYEQLRQYPNSCSSGSGRFNLRVHRPTDCPSWSRLPLINGDKERREEEGRQKTQEASSNSQGENLHMQKKRKKVNRSDTKPVSISNYYGDTSESSDLSSKAGKSLPTEVQRRRNKRREEKQPHNTRKDAVSQGSSSISDGQSVPKPKQQKRNQQSNQRKTAFKTSKVAVDSPKQRVKENKDDGNPIKETLTSISCTVETEGMQRYEKKDEAEEEEEKFSTVEKQVNGVANRYSTENQEKRASRCEERDKEGEVEERYGEQSSTVEEEAQEEENLRSNTSAKESLLEEMGSVRESEAEEEGEGEEEEEDGEKGDEDEKSRASGRGSKEDDNESYQEGNYNEVLASGSETSEKNIQDSLRELYKDETEDDLAEKEGSIDDDDDDVIVEKASPLSCHPVFEDTKYQDDDDDDDDDDIEGLLAPQNNTLQHQADEPEEILKSKGLRSDSEENAQGKDDPVDSGDEYDHFYD